MPLAKPIYLDNHSTTPIDPRVLEAMEPYFKDSFGNPSSDHAYGREAEKAVEAARIKTAELIGAAPEEIIFTSSATESNNLAIQGLYQIYQENHPEILTQVTEHKSVLDVCRYLERKKTRVHYLKVDPGGKIEIEDLKKAMKPEILLISIMFANNEIGTLQPIAAIGRIAKERGIFFHVDAAQAAGKLPIDVEKLGIDLLSFSSHKMYGPKGSAALYIRKKNPRVRIEPLIYGGGHEKGLRSGTLNVPAIVGFGKACEIAVKEMSQDESRIRPLRDQLKQHLMEAIPGTLLNGDPENRLYNHLNLSFPDVDSESLLESLHPRVAISSGSACTTRSKEPSYVLKAIGLPEARIHTSVRFGLGRFTTADEIRHVANFTIETVKRLQKLSPFRAVDKPAI